jgi:tRNA dimethylallyltransferase
VSRHLALVGPTATGKSALALEVAAQAGDIEIVSLDSMQVYRTMDIGTAKPTRAERAAVPHHLIDVADPDEDWSVVQSQVLARAAIAEIEARGNRALLVGGTGLYVRAVVDDLAIPGQDLEARAAFLRNTETEAGLASAYARLGALDPVAAARIEPNNRRRIVRALEVIALTGEPFSSFGPGVDTYGPPVLDVTLVGILLPRDELRTRIEQRFARMRADGLLEEVAALAARPAGISRTAEQAIGYKETLAFVQGTEPSLDAALDLAVRRTRKFARRQRVWFRRDPRVEWIAAPANIADLAPTILATWSGSVPSRTR